MTSVRWWLVAAVALAIIGCKKAPPDRHRKNVFRIYDAARSYYMDGSGKGENKQFPSIPVGPTPPLGTCCQYEGGLCPPNPSLWTHPTWVALGFSVTEPDAYSYEYKVTPLPEIGPYIARSYRDRECDGNYTTYELYGVINPADYDDDTPRVRLDDDEQLTEPVGIVGPDGAWLAILAEGMPARRIVWLPYSLPGSVEDTFDLEVVAVAAPGSPGSRSLGRYEVDLSTESPRPSRVTVGLIAMPRGGVGVFVENSATGRLLGVRW